MGVEELKAVGAEIGEIRASLVGGGCRVSARDVGAVADRLRAALQQFPGFRWWWSRTGYHIEFAAWKLDEPHRAAGNAYEAGAALASAQAWLAKAIREAEESEIVSHRPQDQAQRREKGLRRKG